MNNSTKTVEVFDPTTRTIFPIPADELAPGMVQVYFAEFGRTYWVDSALAADYGEADSPVRHGPLSTSLRGSIRKIMGRLKQVYPLPFKAWEDGFRRDQNPEKEIALWLRISGHYADLAECWELTGPQRQELFQVLLQCTNAPREHILRTVDLASLPRERAQEAIAKYCGAQEAGAAPHELRDPTGQVPRPLLDLQFPGVRDNMETATIVFGVDLSTGKSTLFFGRETLEQIAAGCQGSRQEIISFVYNSRTDELEALAAAVRGLKGSCCYETKGGSR